ncbi:MAG: DUF3006 domain-containing protein [Oscillospiraceae bacterium]|nr:DUF3006 domain-containing protein [Oscillospiraceae bacterium]
MMIIERFEGDFAVLEVATGGHIEVKRELLPVASKEGDVVELQNGIYVVNAEETESRRQNVIARLRKMGL